MWGVRNGGYAIWNATDTLGLTGGVVQVRARIYTPSGTTPAYTIPWVQVSVDSSGAGAAADEVGPGSVNLLTGDYAMSSTDADELGLSVSRTSSSRNRSDGYQAMAERLTPNQKQISTNLTGFTVPTTSSAARSTARGQGETTPVDSLEITPVTTTSNDTYVAVGGDNGGLRLGMTAGKTYRMTGWIYVPAATGLVPENTQRGLRIVGIHRVGGTYSEVVSPMAAYTDGWQELSVDMTVPAGATEAFFRLYNGAQGGSGRRVYWDNLSMTEIVAPFGPAWSGGATGGAADVDYTTLTLPEPSMAVVNTIGGDWTTFAKNTDGTSFTPEPGAEGMTLTRVGSTAYRLSELDGTVTEFTQQGGAWAATSSWTAEAHTATRYTYDTSGDSDRKRERTVRLPAAYVTEHTHLAYASTAYRVQGITVPASHTILTDAMSGAAVYVGMTRGTDENVLHVIAENPAEARQQFIDAVKRDRADRGLTDATQQAAEAVRGLVDDGPVQIVTTEIAALTQQAEHAEQRAALWRQAAEALTELYARQREERDQATRTADSAARQLERVRGEVAAPLTEQASAALAEWSDADTARRAARDRLGTGRQVRQASRHRRTRHRADPRPPRGESADENVGQAAAAW
ncbi:hypothetical protein HCA58_13960 [Micromonospora sp. HNM0581]|uniref:hypothetical protein n=1 Tax=Micromonospora sp. HNM0581 TaxID=2716341 RepID=UPI00146E984E|nr:hypothetical protein [Micromonospora sp. HNM0581]NLU79467.1 hypothetical protein [Micromonospora sp. HNM0581]